MPWPLSQDYNEALQNPQSSFSDPELRQGQVVVNALGIPQPCSGNFADVYAVKCVASKTKWAVKCFTREVHGLRERYSEISKYLQQVRLPFSVDFQYLEQGIRISGRWYPILKMHWVEGFTLNAFVRDSLDKPALLEKLSRVWVRMARRLREADLAHCDLQHGNVLLVPDSEASALAVKLIDYDGMWVPALAKVRSGEIGHPAYQHPQRRREGIYNAQVDRFPLLAIHVALRALIVGGKQLWERYDTGDNMLFRQADFEAPAKSPLFAQLLRMNHPEVRDLAIKLIDAARMSLEQTPHLAELIPDEKPSVTFVPRSQSTAVSRERTAAAVKAESNPFQNIGAEAAKRAKNSPILPWVAAGGVAALALVGSVLLWRPQQGTPSENAPPPSALAQAKNVAKAPAATDLKPLAREKKQSPAQVDKDGSSPKDRPQENSPPPLRDKPASPEEKKPFRLAADASITDLRRALKNEDPAVREVAAARLADLGSSAEPALDDLADALSDEKNPVQVRRNAALALARIGPSAKKGVPTLARALKRTQPLEVRQYAAEALARLAYPANEEAIPAILDALENDRDPTVRQRCVWSLFALREIKKYGADKILTKVLEDTKPGMIFVRYAAARKLATELREAAPDPTADVLLEMLKNKTIKVYNRAEIKVEQGKAPGGGRTNVQADLAGDARFFAAEGLGWLGKKASRRKDIVDALKAATQDADPKLRQAASDTLKSLDVPAAMTDTIKERTPKQSLIDGKMPVPDENLLKSTIEEIRDTYKAEYASTDSNKLTTLAEKLLKRGQKAFEPPERRFALLREASAVAARAGDPLLGVRALDELGKLFAVEELPMKTTILQEAAKNVHKFDTSKSLLEMAHDLLAVAIRNDDYENAERLVKSEEVAAFKSGIPRSALRDTTSEIQRLRGKYASLKSVHAKLAKEPNDPEANRIVGSFRCFDKGDWENGLSLLVRGDDAKLKILAEKDLSAPTSVDACVELADGWWQLAKKAASAPKGNLSQRACHWYQRAVAEATEPTRTRIVANIRSYDKSFPARAWGRLDISQTSSNLGGLLLSKGDKEIVTRASFAGPIEITVLARTEKSNIRLRGGKGSCVIFNWEVNPEELRITRPDGNDRPESGSLATARLDPLRPNTWYLLSWRITEEGMSVSVNGRVVFSENHTNDLTEKHPISVHSVDSDIEVLSFSVRPIRKKSG